nr:MAG TPA_asm: Major head protein [Caudoviricetes sp.]
MHDCSLRAHQEAAGHLAIRQRSRRRTYGGNPTKTLNQAIRTGGLFHAEKRPARCGNGGSMAQETTAAETDPLDPAQGGETDPAPDYKALYENALKESRKWESRSKANLKELDELKAAATKTDPTVEERLSALESENAALKASAARSALVDSVAKATGLDRSIVATLNGEDEDALTEQAKAVAAITKPAGGAPKAPEAGGKPKPGKPSKKDILGIEDKKERMAAIAANIDLFK